MFLYKARTRTASHYRGRSFRGGSNPVCKNKKAKERTGTSGCQELECHWPILHKANLSKRETAQRIAKLTSLNENDFGLRAVCRTKNGESAKPAIISKVLLQKDQLNEGKSGATSSWKHTSRGPGTREDGAGHEHY